MKNYGLVIGICIGVALVILTGAILFEGYKKTKAATEESRTTYELPSYDASGDDASGAANRKTFGTTATESQMYISELNLTVDDEGENDLQTITTAAEGL